LERIKPLGVCPPSLEKMTPERCGAKKKEKLGEIATPATNSFFSKRGGGAYLITGREYIKRRADRGIS